MVIWSSPICRLESFIKFVLKHTNKRTTDIIVRYHRLGYSVVVKSKKSINTYLIEPKFKKRFELIVD